MKLSLRVFAASPLLMCMAVAGYAQTPAASGRSWAASTQRLGHADGSTLDRWQKQIKQALFIPDPLPPLKSESYGVFYPAPGVRAERVTFGTSYGLRVPAIVYRPEREGKRLPGLVIVNGHSGDKTSWYAFYSGILYARAGAVVVTYDPIGEDERNSKRISNARAHDTFLPGAEMPPRMGGQMVTDVLQAVGYLAQRQDVDPARIGVAAYSMGSFHAAIAGAIEPRIHALVLSGGGNLDGPDGYWDSSSKIMCQAGPYHALSFLGDRGAALYALNQRRGPTFVMNGTKDPLIVTPHTEAAFFDDLRNRTAVITGTRRGLFENFWIEGVGHRPNFVTRPAALWLQAQLHFPLWSTETIDRMGEVHVSEWAVKTGARVGNGFGAELSEGGVRALSEDVPNVPREQLQVLTENEWRRQERDFVWESWAERATHSSK